MQTLLQLAEPLTQVVARAGGGGSGGGGGGGGGSLIAAIGYLPAHFVTRWCLQHTNRGVSIIVGSVTAVVVTALVCLLSVGLGIIVGIGAIVGVYSGVHDWLGKLSRRFTTGKKMLNVAASKDPAWQEESVRERVNYVFNAYQQDWSDSNMQHMQTYMTPTYLQHVQLMVAALQQMGRQNAVSLSTLISMNPVDVIDSAINDQDMLSMFIQAKAHDQLIDIPTGKVLYTDDSQFEELWWFERSGETWNLMRIDQATAEGQLRDVALERFAASQGVFYSLDWGWLLLPQRGQLFGKASFKNSDVNNHVIGNWNGHIVQLYTFIPAKSNAENYLVAQIALPKSYGGIIVKRNTGNLHLFDRAPHGYQKISMEWPDFNKRYTVYATDMDKVTSFELLNPSFMANLYDKELPFNIEVVDNVVYLYAPTTKMLVSGSQQRYAGALDVLQAAYKELYM